ncbi:unnamed protein product [Notodromas monacha]|uniref:Uncharacterized protein n=1 Tax=Notodromas monacha TaxID=399045 RepID=A0A7R9BCL2_9CRUS|nr:unnamed protein product [Notodromas monacha]CAG0912853.1 unnamed protein product [Notodromas monacha]
MDLILIFSSLFSAETKRAAVEEGSGHGSEETRESGVMGAEDDAFDQHGGLSGELHEKLEEAELHLHPTGVSSGIESQASDQHPSGPGKQAD